MAMADAYGAWLDKVRDALRSINMSMEDWQPVWVFDFRAQYEEGILPNDAAERANRFWWHKQNQSLEQDCRLTPNCWLPRGHQGECQPVSTIERVN
jgi:hypothetical protein